MDTYNLHNANFEMLLILASRSISDLALQIAQQDGEEVGLLPTEAQFRKAWSANQPQVGWLLDELQNYLRETGQMRGDPQPKPDEPPQEG